MSYVKRALESTDPSFQCSTKIEMTATDIMLSAEWDMRYERLRDEEEARARAAALGENQEGTALRSVNQQQEPKPTRLGSYRDANFAATFNTVKNAIRIHRADCRAWANDSNRPAIFRAWLLEAETLKDAFDEIERTEHATDRILPVDACACARRKAK